MDDELGVQLARLPDIFKAFGIPLYEAEGYEADDVIGTIVKLLRNYYTVGLVPMYIGYSV